MDISRLFGVLVVGGSLLATGCTGNEDTDDLDRKVESEVDGASNQQVADAAETEVSVDASAELMSCGFCPNDCCVVGDDGVSKEKEGFECCWGTMC
jgi:hypothetical protein